MADMFAENSQVSDAAAILTPEEALVAALAFMSASDGDLGPEEQSYIRDICADDPELVKRGVDYYVQHTFEELVDNLPVMDGQQKLCMLANCIEIAMTDGVLEDVEMYMSRHLAAGLGLSEEDHELVTRVLLAKNQLSVFF